MKYFRPLDEGKKVKEKFDAIFSATKYIKCLDAITKQRKAMNQGRTVFFISFRQIKNINGMIRN